MAHLLNEPITTKESAVYSAPGLSVASSSMQGWRESMEDVDIVKLPLDASVPGISCVAVFDGHGGAKISLAASERILQHVMATEEFRKDSKSAESLAIALCKGFLATDADLQKDPVFSSSSDEMGSTGIVALITPTDIICANVGDSRGILSNAASKEVTQMSIDHKPELEFEKQRIMAAGGTVFRGRVCGGVAVSRSFGDFWFKRNDALKPHQQLVTAEPCVRVHRRSSSDEFLALCCDGIFDVMTNDQLRKFIRSQLKAGNANPKAICEQLLDTCLAKNSKDNMSVVLVLFDQAIKDASRKRK